MCDGLYSVIPSIVTRFWQALPPRTSNPPAPSASLRTPGRRVMDLIISFSPNSWGVSASFVSSRFSLPRPAPEIRWRADCPVTTTSCNACEPIVSGFSFAAEIIATRQQHIVKLYLEIIIIYCLLKTFIWRRLLFALSLRHCALYIPVRQVWL